MKVYVISGGPGTGKTTTVNALGKEGFGILEETARLVAEEKFPGKNVKDINPKEFQIEIFKKQKEQLEEIRDKKEIFFSDRGLGDTLAYIKLRVGDIPENILDFAKSFRYSGIFILEPLNFYSKDSLRQEDKDEAGKIHETIIKTYQELGHEIIKVPFMSVKERVRFIKEKIFN